MLEIGPRAPKWAADILKYLNTNKVLDGRQKLRKVKYQEARYTIVDDVLYRRGYNTLS